MIEAVTVVRRVLVVLVCGAAAGLSACVTDPVYLGGSGYYYDPYYSPGYYEPPYYWSGYQERVYYYPYPVDYSRPPGHDHDHDHDHDRHDDHDGHDRGPPPSRPPIDRRPPRDPGHSVSDKPRGPDKPARRQRDDEPDGISRMLRDRVVRKER